MQWSKSDCSNSSWKALLGNSIVVAPELSTRKNNNQLNEKDSKVKISKQEYSTHIHTHTQRSNSTIHATNLYAYQLFVLESKSIDYWNMKEKNEKKNLRLLIFQQECHWNVQQKKHWAWSDWVKSKAPFQQRKIDISSNCGTRTKYFQHEDNVYEIKKW